MEDKPLIIGGKTYISSKRAATVFGYTTDYIGQLSRSKKIGSLLVGRDRFIDYSSLATYVEQIKEANAENEKSRALLLANPIQKLESEPLVEQPTASIPEVSELSTDSSTSITTAAAISPRRDHLQPSVLQNALAISLLVFCFVAASNQGQVALTKLEAYVASSNAISSLANNSFRTEQAAASVTSTGSKIDGYYLGFLNSIGRRIVSIWSSLRSKVLALLEPYAGKKVTEKKVVLSATTTTNLTSADTLTAEDIRLIAREVASQEIARTIDYASVSAVGNLGIVTALSNGKATTTAALTQRIKSSYSDEVNVALDSSGSSGIIRPVFRNPTSDEYLFVVVPVDKRP